MVSGICLPCGTRFMSIACKEKTWCACTMHVYCMQKNMAHLYQVLVPYVAVHIRYSTLCASDTVPYVPCMALMQNSQTSPLATCTHVTIKLLVCFLCFAVGGLAPAVLVPHDRLTVFSVVAASTHVDCCFCVSFVFVQFTFCFVFCCLSLWQALPFFVHFFSCLGKLCYINLASPQSNTRWATEASTWMAATSHR